MGKSKFTNEFKSYVIEKGAFSAVCATKKKIYYDTKKIVLDTENGELITEYDFIAWHAFCCKRFVNEDIDCSLRLMESKYRKVKLARKKIEDIICRYENPVFITLTFTNDILNKTSKQTRRRYVARFLKRYCNAYVANIDFAPNTNREHYHAVISERVDFADWLRFGFVFAEKIHKTNCAVGKLSHYINKLTSHAFKTNSFTRLIYSRN